MGKITFSGEPLDLVNTESNTRDLNRLYKIKGQINDEDKYCNNSETKGLPYICVLGMCNSCSQKEKVLLPRRKECWEKSLWGGGVLWAQWEESHCLPTVCLPKHFLTWQLHGRIREPRQGYLPPSLSELLIHPVTLAKFLSLLDLGFFTCNKGKEWGLQSYQWSIISLLASGFYFLIFDAILERIKPSQANDYLIKSVLSHIWKSTSLDR